MPVDIHADAAHLVQVIRLLGDPDLSKLGLDPSIYWENGRQCVSLTGIRPGSRKRVSSTYEIERIEFQLRSLVQRGPMCCVVKEVGSEERLLMKGVWYDKGCDDYGLLSLIRRKGVQGVSVGNVQFVEKVMEPLSSSALRRDQCLEGVRKANLWFSRVVIDLQGPSITNFGSGLQLVQVLRNTIAGMSCLILYIVLRVD